MVDRIINEERDRAGVRQIIPDGMTLANGWKVPTVNTAIGNLPLISDAALKATADVAPATTTKHTIAVINEDLS